MKKKFSGEEAIHRLKVFFRMYPKIADGLRRAKGDQRWEDFFASLLESQTREEREAGVPVL